MIVDSTLLEEYAYEGEFYRLEIPSGGSLIDREPKRVVVLRTKCDIQESSRSNVHGFSNATFGIYFPRNKEEDIKIRRGDSFRGSIYGMLVEGEVTGVFPSQLGGCVAYVKEFDAE
jgi:hypothetical protein